MRTILKVCVFAAASIALWGCGGDAPTPAPTPAPWMQYLGNVERRDGDAILNQLRSDKYWMAQFEPHPTSRSQSWFLSGGNAEGKGYMADHLLAFVGANPVMLAEVLQTEDAQMDAHGFVLWRNRYDSRLVAQLLIFASEEGDIQRGKIGTALQFLPSGCPYDSSEVGCRPRSSWDQKDADSATQLFANDAKLTYPTAGSPLVALRDHWDQKDADSARQLFANDAKLFYWDDEAPGLNTYEADNITSFLEAFYTNEPPTHNNSPNWDLVRHCGDRRRDIPGRTCFDVGMWVYGNESTQWNGPWYWLSAIVTGSGTAADPWLFKFLYIVRKEVRFDPAIPVQV